MCALEVRHLLAKINKIKQKKWTMAWPISDLMILSDTKADVAS